MTESISNRGDVTRNQMKPMGGAGERTDIAVTKDYTLPDAVVLAKRGKNVEGYVLPAGKKVTQEMQTHLLQKMSQLSLDLDMLSSAEIAVLIALMNAVKESNTAASLMSSKMSVVLNELAANVSDALKQKGGTSLGGGIVQAGIIAGTSALSGMTQMKAAAPKAAPPAPAGTTPAPATPTGTAAGQNATEMSAVNPEPAPVAPDPAALDKAPVQAGSDAGRNDTAMSSLEAEGSPAAGETQTVPQQADTNMSVKSVPDETATTPAKSAEATPAEGAAATPAAGTEEVKANNRAMTLNLAGQGMAQVARGGADMGAAVQEGKAEVARNMLNVEHSLTSRSDDERKKVLEIKEFFLRIVQSIRDNRVAASDSLLKA